MRGLSALDEGVAWDGRVIASEVLFSLCTSVDCAQSNICLCGIIRLNAQDKWWRSRRSDRRLREIPLYFSIYFDRIWQRPYLMESHRPMQTIFSNNFNYAVEASHPIIIIIFVWKFWVHDVTPVRMNATWKCLALFFTWTHPTTAFDRFSRPQTNAQKIGC